MNLISRTTNPPFQNKLVLVHVVILYEESPRRSSLAATSTGAKVVTFKIRRVGKGAANLQSFHGIEPLQACVWVGQGQSRTCHCTTPHLLVISSGVCENPLIRRRGQTKVIRDITLCIHHWEFYQHESDFLIDRSRHTNVVAVGNNKEKESA